MPSQLRQTFAFICVFCSSANALTLWEHFWLDMCEDYLMNDLEDIARKKTLTDIKLVLISHNYTCASFNLPDPVDLLNDEIILDIEQETVEYDQRLNSLNQAQREAFNNIVNAINDNTCDRKCFYLDGPGGSGKTYLYNTSMNFLRSRGDIVLPFVTTGIAATLLRGGRTVHSGFKLAVPLLDNSTSQMRLNSTEANLLRQASLIIIDKATMMQKDGLRCIDLLLRVINQCEDLFGNKVIILDGDFRQTLPVVPKGTKKDVLETCLKSSHLWRHFQKIQLISNMRSEGQIEFNE